MGDLGSSVVTVLLAVIGVAVVAVLVSKNANTSGVLNAGGSAFSGILGAATNPFSSSGFTGSIPSFGSSNG